jgi:hypothetical protein
MSHFDCHYCGNKAKQLKKIHEEIETKFGYCRQCEFRWWPNEEEEIFDKKLREKRKSA